MEIRTPDRGRALYRLTPGQNLVVGREEGEVRVPSDGKISSQHVFIRTKKSEIIFEDLQSTNGTWHRKRRKASGVILPGDELKVGETTVVFHDKEPSRD